jgi:hypothetical protein
MAGKAAAGRRAAAARFHRWSGSPYGPSPLSRPSRGHLLVARSAGISVPTGALYQSVTVPSPPRTDMGLPRPSLARSGSRAEAEHVWQLVGPQTSPAASSDLRCWHFPDPHPFSFARQIGVFSVASAWQTPPHAPPYDDGTPRSVPSEAVDLVHRSHGVSFPGGSIRSSRAVGRANHGFATRIAGCALSANGPARVQSRQ